jgi:diadenylate cyclase
VTGFLGNSRERLKDKKRLNPTSIVITITAPGRGASVLDYFAGLTFKNSIKDIIDVLLVSYIIYRLIIMVRGTRAVQLLRGIMLLVITWALSTWFHLYTLMWLMNQMFTLGVVTVLIIFQPELRRALEQLGTGKLFMRNSQEEQDVSHQINEVMKSVNYLASRKIGALIVFERSTGLNDYIESGIKMNSKLSSELLSNVFVPNTPLHDGAVIIRGNQIMAAGCYLPLSENPFISKELGTRHRAAIGVSEVCDAISVVVSEETGQVSLAINGQIVRDIKEESLISKLFDELRPQFKARNAEWKAFWKRKEGGNRG